MKDYFKLIECEPDKEYIIHEGTFNECVDVFESIFGITFYQGIEYGLNKFYIEEI